MDSESDGDTDEQLRARQNDEFKALKECFSDQLVDLRKLTKVSKNPKKRKREKIWIPLELSVKIDTHPEPIAGFELHIKCTRKYPLVPPAIGFKSVRGIGRRLIAKLHKQLKQETSNEEHQGQGCIALLIMRAQQFLEDHYRDLELNNKSFYDQMVEQKQNCDREAEMSKRYKDELDKMERERQVEEMRQKILRKRELYNESRKRRDSQNSNVELDPDESVYDFDGDLEADGTTASLTSDGEATTSRLHEVEEETENEDITVRSRRSTFVGTRPEIRLNGDYTNEKRPSIQSRVDSEYEVIEELGHGGFGTVYKVRNRVDSRYYALKKVKLNSDNETLNERIMREVKLLSRLNHENVIRYYIAWDEIETQEVSSSKNLSTTTTNTTNEESALSPCVLSQRDLSRSSDDEADDVYCTSYLINDRNVEKIDVGETTANYVVFEDSDNRDENEIVESMKKALGPRMSDAESSEDDADHTHSTGPRLKINRWLYIQMELGQGTLREAIDQGLPKQKDRARRFFLEILDGLCHIHRQGIIHRDLKPVNIFLDSMDRPKIGDFGLATTNLFIVTQNNSPGVHTATAIKPNRMSLERLRLLASPEQGDSMNDMNKSGERLKYIHHNHTDNIGTPLYMSPELSATNEGARIAKVIYSHKVDVYSLGIIYFEMLYSFKTGHERIIILQDLRKKSIIMPPDVDNHLSKEDIELIKLLLTHDVAARPTTEKLLTSNLLPSVGMREREYQNIIKQVVQNRQARTHKQMLRLLFEQNDSYADDFVFDYEDIDGSSSSTISSTKNDHQAMLKDFNTITYILDQVKMRLELVLKSRGYVKFVTPTLMPKYTASKYYNKQQLDDVVMLMDKNSSILTLPYDLRLPFARTIARSNINYMYRFAIEKIYRQRQILGYHPDQLWECCVDIITPPLPKPNQFHFADAEILNLIGDIVKSFPVVINLKPTIKLNSIEYVKSLMILANISESLVDDILRCISESLNVSMKSAVQYAGQTSVAIQLANSLSNHVKDELRKDLMNSRLVPSVAQINDLINLIDIVGSSPMDVMDQLEQINLHGTKSGPQLKEIRRILMTLEDTIHYGQGLGLDLPIKFSAGFVLNALRPVDFYSGMICMLECKRHFKAKTKTQLNKSVILAVGGRYDKLINKFPRDRFEVFDRKHNSSGADTIGERNEKENRPKVAVGVSFEVEKFSRFVLEDYVDKLTNSDPLASPSIPQLIQLNNNLVQQSALSIPPTGGLCMRYWPIDLTICSLTHPKPRLFIHIMSTIVKQLRDKGLMCNEILPNEQTSFTLTSLVMTCSENKIPFLMTIKSQSNDITSADDDELGQSPSQPSIVASISPSASPIRGSYLNSAVLATLYRVDKSGFREIKRCDTQSMVEFLTSKK